MVENKITPEEELLMNLKNDLSKVFLKNFIDYAAEKFRPVIRNWGLKIQAWKERLLQE